MRNYKYLELFNNLSSDRYIKISYSSGYLDNTILSDDFTVRDSLCSNESLLIGSCESSELTFKFRNDNIPSLKGELLDVELYVEEHPEPLELGQYKVMSDEVSDDRKYRTIKAYDKLYDILNEDYIDWYVEFFKLNEAVTLKEFRNAFFYEIGVSQEETTLANDDLIISYNENITTFLGSQILISICEINGVFGHMRYDTFIYVSLNNNNPIIIDNYASPLKYEDYVCQKIACIKIINNEGDIATVIGEGVTYIVNNNFLCYNKDTKELVEIGSNLLSIIKDIEYRPINDLQVIGNPCYEVGDAIEIVKEDWNISTYILERVFTGIQGSRDSYTSKGTEEPEDNPNSSYSQIQSLKNNVEIFFGKVDNAIESKVAELMTTSKNMLPNGLNLVGFDILFKAVDEDGEILTDEYGEELGIS